MIMGGDVDTMKPSIANLDRKMGLLFLTNDNYVEMAPK